jgi:hypothetical protein
VKEMTDQERLVVGVMASLVSALGNVVEGRDHHRLCFAACTMIPMYKDKWPQIYAEKWDTFDEERRDGLKKIYNHIVLISGVAEYEKASGYRQANQRSLIFLADVMENLTESFLQVCLIYIDDKVVPIKKITGRRPRNMTSAVDIRKSVREWERSLKETSRSRRFKEMIQTFFASFDLESAKLDNLDRLMIIRNKLVHELIHIPTKGEAFDPLPQPTLEEVDQFHSDVADYIQRLMDEFREVSGLPTPRTQS